MEERCADALGITSGDVAYFQSSGGMVVRWVESFWTDVSNSML
jgi:hypothetical protein